MGPGCFYPGNAVVFFGGAKHDVASMGPGCFYPGNHPAGGRMTPLVELQWGRDVSIPEMSAKAVDEAVDKELQWGRDVSIPEMYQQIFKPVGLRRFNGAGMFLSRKSRRSPGAASCAECFNGAGMFLSRKSAVASLRVASSGGFNGAGMFLSRKSSGPCAAWPPYPRFNGAGMFLSRKYRHGARWRAVRGASMGPGC